MFESSVIYNISHYYSDVLANYCGWTIIYAWLTIYFLMICIANLGLRVYLGHWSKLFKWLFYIYVGFWALIVIYCIADFILGFLKYKLTGDWNGNLMGGLKQ